MSALFKEGFELCCHPNCDMCRAPLAHLGFHMLCPSLPLDLFLEHSLIKVLSVFQGSLKNYPFQVVFLDLLSTKSSFSFLSKSQLLVYSSYLACIHSFTATLVALYLFVCMTSILYQMKNSSGVGTWVVHLSVNYFFPLTFRCKKRSTVE